MCWTLGWDRFLMVQLPITLIAGSIGVFLFYVQHQYEDTYWRYREAWNYFAAGLEGASHLTMPKPLQWATASIGLHHIHHIASRIPNYELQRAYDNHPELRQVTRLSLWKSVTTLRLTLWDEDDEAPRRIPRPRRHPPADPRAHAGRRRHHRHQTGGRAGLVAMSASVRRFAALATTGALALLATAPLAAQEICVTR